MKPPPEKVVLLSKLLNIILVLFQAVFIGRLQLLNDLEHAPQTQNNDQRADFLD
jgi:hypothetical protein